MAFVGYTLLSIFAYTLCKLSCKLPCYLNILNVSVFILECLEIITDNLSFSCIWAHVFSHQQPGVTSILALSFRRCLFKTLLRLIKVQNTLTLTSLVCKSMIGVLFFFSFLFSQYILLLYRYFNSGLVCFFLAFHFKFFTTG